jgi:hypothetical protein
LNSRERSGPKRIVRDARLANRRSSADTLARWSSTATSKTTYYWCNCKLRRKQSGSAQGPDPDTRVGVLKAAQDFTFTRTPKKASLPGHYPTDDSTAHIKHILYRTSIDIKKINSVIENVNILSSLTSLRKKSVLVHVAQY